MASRLLIGLLASTVLATSAMAQTATTTPAPAPSVTTTTTTSTTTSGQWRSSKLMGLDVYNDSNEKLGDISEILVDPAGKVTGVVIGVGGFLGIGQHDILLSMEKLKFVNEPMKTATTGTTSTAPAGTGGMAPAPRPTVTASNDQWSPNHAILPGATKETLQNLPAFKYN